MGMRRLIFAITALGLVASGLSAQGVPPELFQDLRWRCIGPFRAGWSTCVEGIPDQPDVFYFGAAGGGIWKSEDAGRTWQPLFPAEGAACVDSLAIAPSNPKILYAGSGQVETRYDIASGNGIYRSDDGGKTWRHLGLAKAGAIGRILVDPTNPDVVVVAALGHIFGPNPERGLFRSEDGGKTWQKSLFVDDDTGAVDLAADPGDFSVLYAAAWQARNYPWLSYFHPDVGPGSGVFKSTDAGRSWTRLSGGGWPEGPLGRIGLAAARGGRVYAVVDARTRSGNVPRKQQRKSRGGLFRSDDGGAHWSRVCEGDWLENDYFGRLTVDPSNPERVYAMGQSVRRSEDGGRTFEIVKGAPGGDDYHFLWINPKHTDHMAVASDQGTVVSVNGGRTWSSWYNQPTGQFYHLAADDQFPYWVYSGQQDSGTVGIASRSDYGALSFREWHPVGGEERDYDVPDPSDPNLVYGTGLGGSLTLFDTRTGQVASIAPTVESNYAKRPTEVKYRFGWITPIAVSPRPPHAIFLGSQVLFRSTDRGRSWGLASPDLTGAVPGAQGCDGEVGVENARPCGFGVIWSIALSPKSDDEIWVGTDSGLIQVTRDGGKTWSDVTPKGLLPWSKVSTLDISPLDPSTVYAAIDAHRLDDFTPRAFRTRDGGRNWTPIAEGLPKPGFVSALRADPGHRGLLYAGTDTGVFVSFDDGDHWQPLKLNLPTAWVRDLLVHGDDLIAATQGRALWILDDVTPLRQVEAPWANDPALLFAPAPAYRVRKNENKDTPLPPETPLGENPPAGAMLDYFVGAGARPPLTLEILDSDGNIVRRYSSEDPPEKLDAERYFAKEWLKPPAPPSAAPGHHRFLWDLRYSRPRAATYDYSIAAIWGEDTPALPEGALAVPGLYSVRLAVGGKSWTQPLTLKRDPRLQTTDQEFSSQLDAARQAADLMDRSMTALEEVRAFRKSLAARKKSAAGLEPKVAAFETGSESFSRVNERLRAVFEAVESADVPPTAQAMSELESTRQQLDTLLVRWNKLQSGGRAGR
jgi:photosystem II stability/assembly factor-like uncharacterized protein